MDCSEMCASTRSSSEYGGAGGLVKLLTVVAEIGALPEARRAVVAQAAGVRGVRFALL